MMTSQKHEAFDQNLKHQGPLAGGKGHELAADLEQDFIASPHCKAYPVAIAARFGTAAARVRHAFFPLHGPRA